MLSPYALCTFNDLTEYLAGQDTIPATQQALVEHLINRWGRWAGARCNRFFGQNVYVNELHSGTGRQIFMLNQPPVWSVKQISMLTAPGTWGLIIDPSEYWLQDTDLGAVGQNVGTQGTGQNAGGGMDGMVWRERGWWAGLLETPGLVTNEPHPWAIRQNISSTYVGGWALPRDFATLTATPASGGSLVSGTYYYRITQVITVTVMLNQIAFTIVAEPIISPEISATLGAGQGTVNLAWGGQPPIPAPGPGSTSFAAVSGTVATAYRIYRGAFPGGESVYYQTTDLTSMIFADTGAASTAGIPPVDLPDDLRGALMQIVAGQYKLRAKQGIASEVFAEGGGSLNIKYDRAFKDATDVIDQYRLAHTVVGI